MFFFSKPFVQDEQAELVNEVLKVLYNLVLHIDKNSPDEEEDSHCLRLISILRYLLLASTRCPEKTDSLHRLVAVVLIFFRFLHSYLSLLFSLLFLSHLLLLSSTCYPKKTGFWYNMMAVALVFLLFVLFFYICLSPTLSFSSFLSSSLAVALSSSLPSFLPVLS